MLFIAATVALALFASDLASLSAQQRDRRER
jgi:hypothetical protein